MKKIFVLLLILNISLLGGVGNLYPSECAEAQLQNAQEELNKITQIVEGLIDVLISFKNDPEIGIQKGWEYVNQQEPVMKEIVDGMIGDECVLEAFYEWSMSFYDQMFEKFVQLDAPYQNYEAELSNLMDYLTSPMLALNEDGAIDDTQSNLSDEEIQATMEKVLAVIRENKDVLSQIPPDQREDFINNLVIPLKEGGVAEDKIEAFIEEVKEILGW